MLHLEHGFVWCWNLDASSSRSEIPGKFWNVVLEKDGEDHVRNEEVLLRVNEQKNILHVIRKRKANWIGHILRRNCLLKQVFEGKMKGEMEVTRRWGRRSKKLLDDIKDRRGYSHLKEEALDCTLWRNRFGGGFGPVVRQNTEWMNENKNSSYLFVPLSHYFATYSPPQMKHWSMCLNMRMTFLFAVATRVLISP